MPSGLFYLNCLDRYISISGVSGQFLFLTFFIESPVFNANSVDPDQTPPDLGLYCLPVSLLWEARDKWVNCSI